LLLLLLLLLLPSVPFAFCLLPSSFFNSPQHVANLHVRPVLVDDGREYAGLGRRDFDVDLVGLELDERLADRHGITFLLEPLRDAGVDDRLAHFGDDNVGGHRDSLQDLSFTLSVFLLATLNAASINTA